MLANSSKHREETTKEAAIDVFAPVASLAKEKLQDSTKMIAQLRVVVANFQKLEVGRSKFLITGIFLRKFSGCSNNASTLPCRISLRPRLLQQSACLMKKLRCGHVTVPSA